MNKIAESRVKTYITYENNWIDFHEYKRLAHILIQSLSESEFKDVFQTQKQNLIGVNEDETKYEVAFQNYNLKNPSIIQSNYKKLNKLQRFIKKIFKL